ncbi:MAG: imidazoleglycerol-phosphate dehydratase [Dethiobacteria bacterium]|jgi:imidazoleglycerol-phosphate dehydratase
MRQKIVRKTSESEIAVIVDLGPRHDEPKKGLKTPLPFLNHMLEHIIWRGEINLEVEIKVRDFYLTHVVCEDLGQTFGRAIKECVGQRLDEGVKGFGFALATIDEALSRAVISFENRASLHLHHPGVVMPREVEEIPSEDLITFFEGFIQGADCTLHLDLIRGENGHHIWEATFRAFGEALRSALQVRPWRKGMTAGVAGPIRLEMGAGE